MTVAENKPESEFTTNTSYLDLMGELWYFYSEYFGENWQYHNPKVLYINVDLWFYWIPNFIHRIGFLFPSSAETNGIGDDVLHNWTQQ